MGKGGKRIPGPGKVMGRRIKGWCPLNTTVSPGVKKWLQQQKSDGLKLNVIINNVIKIHAGLFDMEIYRHSHTKQVYGKHGCSFYKFVNGDEWAPCMHIPTQGLTLLSKLTWGQLYGSFATVLKSA